MRVLVHFFLLRCCLRFFKNLSRKCLSYSSLLLSSSSNSMASSSMGLKGFLIEVISLGMMCKSEGVLKEFIYQSHQFINNWWSYDVFIFVV